MPAGTATEAGTVASEVLALDRLTVAPLDPAAEVIVTVPVQASPPVRVVGETETAERVGAFTAIELLTVIELNVAVISTLVAVFTGEVETVKVVVFLPDATVTEEGTVATTVSLLARVTATPAGPAFP